MLKKVSFHWDLDSVPSENISSVVSKVRSAYLSPEVNCETVFTCFSSSNILTTNDIQNDIDINVFNFSKQRKFAFFRSVLTKLLTDSNNELILITSDKSLLRIIQNKDICAQVHLIFDKHLNIDSISNLEQTKVKTLGQRFLRKLLYYLLLIMSWCGCFGKPDSDDDQERQSKKSKIAERKAKQTKRKRFDTSIRKCKSPSAPRKRAKNEKIESICGQTSIGVTDQQDSSKSNTSIDKAQDQFEGVLSQPKKDSIAEQLSNSASSDQREHQSRFYLSDTHTTNERNLEDSEWKQKEYQTTSVQNRRQSHESKHNKQNQFESRLPDSWPFRRSSNYAYITPGVCGLTNLGNTCYMNSGIQCLSNIQVLTEFALNSHPKPRYYNQNNLFDIYCGLIKQMWSGGTGSLSPRSFKSKVSALFPKFSGFDQNDCLELLTSVLSRFHEEMNQRRGRPLNDSTDYHSYDEYLKDNNTLIAQNFHGFQRFRLTCPCGQLLMQNSNPFCVLNLPQNSPNDNWSNTKISVILITKFNNFFKIELKFSENIITAKDLLENLTKAIQSTMKLDLKNLIITKFVQSKLERIFRNSNLIHLDQLKKSEILMIYEKDPNLSKPTFMQMAFDSQKGPKYFGIPILLNINENDPETVITEFLLQFKVYLTKEMTESDFDSMNNVNSISNSDPDNTLSETLLTITIPGSIAHTYRNPIYKNSNKFSIIENRGYDSYQSYIRLEESLDKYIAIKPMDSDDRLYCSQCGTKVSPNQQDSITFAPNVLILQLKTNPNQQRFSRTTEYEFPSELDFQKYVLDQNQSLKYDLIAISNYMGSAYSGHYTAYAKNFMTKKWYHFNDSCVNEMNEPSLRSSKAYLLFYIIR